VHVRSNQCSARKRVVAPSAATSLVSGLAPAAALTAVVGGALSGGLHAVSGELTPSCKLIAILQCSAGYHYLHLIRLFNS
jgi:hypothetical protein